MKYNNPPDKYDLFLIWIAFIISVIFSLLGYFLILDNIFSFGAAIMGSIYLFADYYKQYIIKPKSVAIQEQGITLYFRFRPDRFVPWDEIEGIYSKPGPDPNRLGKTIAEGGVKIRFKDDFKFYRVSFEISRELIEGYKHVMGGGTRYLGRHRLVFVPSSTKENEDGCIEENVGCSGSWRNE